MSRTCLSGQVVGLLCGRLLRHLLQLGFWGFCLKTFAAHKHRCLGVPSWLPEAHPRTSHRRLRLEPRHFYFLSNYSVDKNIFCRNFWSTIFLILAQAQSDRRVSAGIRVRAFTARPFLGLVARHPSLNHDLAWHTRPPCVKWCACAGASFHKNVF